MFKLCKSLLAGFFVVLLLADLIPVEIFLITGIGLLVLAIMLFALFDWGVRDFQGY
jgi:hypothetical protein